MIVSLKKLIVEHGRKYGYPFFLAVIMLFLGSCNDSRVFCDKSQEIITSQPWVIKHFVYAGTDQTLDLGCTIYSFDNEMNFRRTDCDGNLISDGYWQLQQDSSYLIIAGNTYKIIFLSKKILTLRYGQVEICMLPVE